MANVLFCETKTFSDSKQNNIALTLEVDAELDTLPDDYLSYSCIAIHFPVFTDGRGYSLARMLRESGYQNELRATGDILIDQLYYLQRCGFTSFALAEGQSKADAIKALDTFSLPYQLAADSFPPIYAQYLTTT